MKINDIGSKNQTKRKKTKKNIKKMWNAFDIENNTKESMECLYDKQNLKRRDKCDLCQSIVALDEKNMMICTNKKCGIIYKDTLDESAEWRYYGADDNNMRDPTRCGMPINPLLKESSYGCKVICSNRSTYEMRKIRRYTEWQSMPYKEKSQYDEFQRITIMDGYDFILYKTTIVNS